MSFMNDILNIVKEQERRMAEKVSDVLSPFSPLKFAPFSSLLRRRFSLTYTL